ncbi:DUF4179 domain-containing protein [Brevibacillus centrosporus]|uniref:DUF4179 domain-containing protein n=1 Tax=Brevibacillus centrosporus TaxID=54910 RepID=UPI003D1C9B55
MHEDQSWEQLEQELWKDKQRVESIPVPEKIDLSILRGMQQAKQQLAQRQRRSHFRWATSGIACLILLGLFFSIRLSPAVAAYVSHLPGMEKLVELIRDDKGLQMAAEHNMIQPIGASAEHDGVRFTVDQVLMDQKRMLLFYTIRHEQPGHHVELNQVKFYNQNGEQTTAGYSWSSRGDNEESRSSLEQNRLDVYWQDTTHIPDALVANVTLTVDQKQLDTPFQVSFPIDKRKYESLKETVYPLNQKVTVDDQQFTITKIVVYPTQTEVSIQFDPANSKRIFGFDQLRLEDEKGRTYSFWGNGIVSTPDGETGVTYNLESVYFEQPKQLVLKADGIRALDKHKLQVVIDAKTGKLIKAPDSRLTLSAIRQNQDVVGIDLSLQVGSQDENRMLSVGNDLTDDRGNQYEYASGSTSSRPAEEPNKGYLQNSSILYKRKTDKGAPQEYRFTLEDYTSRLSTGFSVPITGQ